MAGNLKGITIEFGGETTKLGKALKDVEKTSRTATNELKQINRQLKFDPKSTTMLAQKQQVLAAAIAGTTQKLALLKDTQSKIKSGEVEATEEEYRQLERDIAKCEAQLKAFKIQQQSIASGATQIRALGSEWQKQGESVAAVGKKLLPITVALGAIGAASAKAAIEFESSFAGVRKTVDATEQEFEKLAETAREMAMSKPVDVNDVNLIMELGGQLGIATENLDSFAGIIADLDVATNLDIETAATDMAQFANITGMAQTEFSNFGSTIVALGNTTATTESAIMNMSMRIAGAGTQIGLSNAQILGLAAALSSAGIEAEAGGTAISTVMSNIDKAVALNTKELETWASVSGMTVDEFKQRWQTDAAGALQAVFQGMSDASAGGENLNVILDELGISSLRQTDMMKRMSNASGLLASSMNTASSAWSENNALANEAAQRYATTESQIEILKNKMYDAAISIGQGMQPALLSMLEAVTPLVEGIGSLAQSYANMNPVARSIVNTTVAMAAGLAPLLLITGKMTSGVGKLMVNLANASEAFIAYKVAQDAGTAATTRNTLANQRSTIVMALKGLKDNIAAATAARKAAATTADTVATTANTAAQGANGAVTAASGAISTATTVKTAALTVARGAQTVATNLATVAQVALNAAMKANPIGVVIMAIGALVAILSILKKALANTEDGTDDLTQATKEQKSEVAKATAEYEAAAAAHGKNSDEAIKAKAALEDEKVKLEECTQTLGEFNEELQSTVKSHDELMDSINETSDSANASAGAILNLSDQISELSAKENKSADDKAQLAALTAALNGKVDGLNLSYDASTDSLNMNVEAMEALAKAESDRLRSEAAMQNYQSLLEDEASLTNDLVAAKEELAAQGIDVTNATKEETYASMTHVSNMGHATVVSYDYNKAQSELIDSYYELNDKLTENKNKQTAAIKTMTELTTKSDAVKKAVNAVEDGTMTAAEAAEYYTQATGQTITVDDIKAEQDAQLAQAELDKAQATSEATDALNAYIAENPEFKSVLESNGYSVDTFAQKLSSCGVSVDDLTAKIENHADATTNAFDKIEMKSDYSLDSMLETLQYNQQATNDWADNITELYNRAGSDSERQFVEYIASLGVEYAPLVQQLLDDTDGKLGELAAAYDKGGDSAKNAALAQMGLLSKGVEKETDNLTTNTTNQLKQGGTAGGTAFGENTSSGMSSKLGSIRTQALAILNAARGGTSGMGASGNQSGTKFGSGISSGMNSTKGSVSSSSSALAKAANSMVSQFGNSFTWGSHVGENLASGLTSAIGKVRSAAGAVASAIANALKHTVPKEGVLREGGRGEVVWGEHIVDNLTQGMENRIPNIKKTTSKLTEAIKGGVSDAISLTSGDVLQTTNGIEHTFGVDISQATLSALKSSSQENASRLDAITDAINKMTESINPDYQIVMDTGVVAGQLASPIDRNLGKIQTRRARGL